MNKIINSSFNKHPMSWDLIHFRLFNPSDSAIKAMCRHETQDGLKKTVLIKYTNNHVQYATHQKLQLSTRPQKLIPVTLNQENLFTWDLILQPNFYMWFHLHAHSRL